MRTALFVPGNRPERIDKALRLDADAVIVDLEDAVPVNLKSYTRNIVRDKIRNNTGGIIFVRLNSLETGHTREDLDAVVTDDLRGVMLPKVEGADHVAKINTMIIDVERARERDADSIVLLLLIETALAVENISAIVTAASRLKRTSMIAFGAVDFALDMGITLSSGGDELLYPRAKIAVSTRSGNLPPPIDTPFVLDLKDLEALEKDALRAKSLGFGGKLCIHPNQIAIVNKVFTPTEEEIEKATMVVKCFQEAEAQGISAIQVEGKFIDYPVVEQARRILDMAEYLSNK